VIIFLLTQLSAAMSSVSSVSVAGVDLPVAKEIKVLGVTLNRRLTFHKHVSAVAGAVINRCAPCVAAI